MEENLSPRPLWIVIVRWSCVWWLVTLTYSRNRWQRLLYNLKMATPTSPISIMSNPGSSANINKRQRPPRPKITLNIPPPNASSQIQSPFMYPVPHSAMSGGTNKSSNYPQSSDDNDMFKQLGDFTKAGLGHGEKVIIIRSGIWHFPSCERIT